MFNKESILRQRRATKRIAIKRLKKQGLQNALNNINKLEDKFLYNKDYYAALKKGLVKLNKKKRENKNYKKLTIQQCEHETLGKWYRFKLIDLKTKNIIMKDSIDDKNQGIETAAKQIQGILRKAGQIQ